MNHNVVQEENEMHTYTQLLYQIIFHTKRNEKTLLKENRKELYSYMASIINSQKSFTYEIGGTSNHVHIITRIHPTIIISNLVKDIKLSTSKMIKSKHLSPKFEGWQQGYSVFSYSPNELEVLINYAQNQEQHHKEESSRDEYKRLLDQHEIEYDERYLF
jgi:REP element-mobilizing transposase RayT